VSTTPPRVNPAALPSPVPNEEAGGPHPCRRDHRAVAHEKGQPEGCPQPHPHRQRRGRTPYIISLSGRGQGSHLFTLRISPHLLPADGSPALGLPPGASHPTAQTTCDACRERGRALSTHPELTITHATLHSVSSLETCDLVSHVQFWAACPQRSSLRSDAADSAGVPGRPRSAP